MFASFNNNYSSIWLWTITILSLYLSTLNYISVETKRCDISQINSKYIITSYKGCQIFCEIRGYKYNMITEKDAITDPEIKAAANDIIQSPINHTVYKLDYILLRQQLNCTLTETLNSTDFTKFIIPKKNPPNIILVYLDKLSFQVEVQRNLKDMKFLWICQFGGIKRPVEMGLNSSAIINSHKATITYERILVNFNFLKSLSPTLVPVNCSVFTSIPQYNYVYPESTFNLIFVDKYTLNISYKGSNMIIAVLSPLGEKYRFDYTFKCNLTGVYIAMGNKSRQEFNKNPYKYIYDNVEVIDNLLIAKYEFQLLQKLCFCEAKSYYSELFIVSDTFNLPIKEVVDIKLTKVHRNLYYCKTKPFVESFVKIHWECKFSSSYTVLGKNPNPFSSNPDKYIYHSIKLGNFSLQLDNKTLYGGMQCLCVATVRFTKDNILKTNKSFNLPSSVNRLQTIFAR